MDKRMHKSTETLVSESVAGNSEAFSELILRYERAAWLAAWKTVRDHHLASDATQNAFVEAYMHLHQLKSPSTFGAWLMRIVYREAIRVAKRVENSASLNPLRDIEQPPKRSSDDDDLILAICKLPDHERIVVTLRYFGGFSLADIAKDIGSPVGTVSKQLSRAIQRLKAILEENVL